MNASARAVFGPGATDGMGESPLSPRPRTALPVREGTPRHLGAHLARLRAGARALGEDVPWLEAATDELRTWLAIQSPKESALRLVLHPQILVATLEPLPVAPTPYRLALLPHPMGDLRPDPLARHKGLSGPWSAAALEEARRRGADDALLSWPDGTVVETAIAAVAQERNGRLHLPPAEGRVASVAERLDLPAWAAARGWTADTGRIAPREGRLWCMNALRGIWPAELL
ncbi:aminotransferase class IV [Geothrix sp. 21YS21S-4]|uniref:aminotransferase class IV n=1 Tax=Geothrix sp. 21YS21S-4 TaxID=3068889 RepID=UPI0027BA51FB|nr:aminotransferase class IV [Geothrix sp. 21YS21S-4]